MAVAAIALLDAEDPKAPAGKAAPAGSGLEKHMSAGARKFFGGS